MPKRIFHEAFGTFCESPLPPAKITRHERAVNVGNASELGNYHFSLDDHLRAARANSPRSLSHAPPDHTESNTHHVSEESSTDDGSKDAEAATLWGEMYLGVSHSPDPYAQNGLFDTWRLEARRLFQESKRWNQHMQEAYGELRQRRIHLPSPARSDEGSDDFASDPDADEYGITPQHLNIEEDDTRRIQSVFGVEYARRFAKRRKQGQLPLSVVQTRTTGGSPIRFHPRQRYQRVLESQHHSMGASHPRRRNSPRKNQHARRSAATGADTREEHRDDIAVMLPARLTRRAAHQASHFFELDAYGRPRRVHTVIKP